MENSIGQLIEQVLSHPGDALMILPLQAGKLILPERKIKVGDRVAAIITSKEWSLLDKSLIQINEPSGCGVGFHRMAKRFEWVCQFAARQDGQYFTAEFMADDVASGTWKPIGPIYIRQV